MNKDRFILQSSTQDPSGWVLTDTEHGVVIKFKEHQFNETQKVSLLNEDKFTPNEIQQLASIIREMTDWLTLHHYYKAMPEPENIRERMGMYILAAMRERGMTVERLAELSQCNISNISRIVHGKYSVGIDVLNRILTALGKKLDIRDITNGG